MTRIAFAFCVVGALALAQDVVGSQTSASVTLVHVPIPVYPPIALATLISGDVHVTVDVRGDGTVASAAVAKVEGFSQQSITAILAGLALDAARNARFRCEACGVTSHSYSLLFSFRFAHTIGRAEGDLHPEVVSISPSQSRILIVAAMPLGGQGPVARPGRARAARCLWLWHCRIYKDRDPGDPELVLRSVTVPVYPVSARADMASADIEVNVSVRHDGTVVSAAIGTTNNLVSSNQGIELAFQKAAIDAARQATFICRRCRSGTLPYSLVYAFRFDGVVAPLDAGYAIGGTTTSASQARVLVPADVPILEAALNLRADALPAACRLAPARPAGGDPTVSVNPWSGDQKHLISLVGAHIAGRPGSDPALPYELQLVQGVRQAYVARYVDGDREPVAVYGLQFGDANDARAFAELGAKTAAPPFVVHRQIVVVVRGGTACADAVAARIKKP